MARHSFPDLSPWRRRSLTIPPTSPGQWISLAVWEAWMGVLLCAAVVFGTRLIASAPTSIVKVYDYSNCFVTPPVPHPCERILYQAGTLNVVFTVWCGVLMLVVAAGLIWELWNAVAPKPVTDDFLKLLDDSFGRDWRRVRTWPWARLAWAYGFTMVGVIVAVSAGLLFSSAMASSSLVKTPAGRVETSQSFRAIP